MQLTPSILALALTASSAVAAPFTNLLQARTTLTSSLLPEEKVDSVWKIHESCNGTQRAQISSAITDMKLLASNSISHLLNHPTSEYFVKYFGATADPAPVIGYYQQLISGDKGNAMLRCDDIDGNCRFPDWNGHWRGNNATSETVICDLSFFTRRPLEQLCAFGYQLGSDNPSQYFGADLMHRAFHLPEFVHDAVHHYADTYQDCLELAKINSTAAVSNQHSLQYFALDVYSRKVTKWGCVGEIKPKNTASTNPTETTSSAPTTTTASLPAAAPTTTEAASTQTTTSDCHTHADGSIHCGTH